MININTTPIPDEMEDLFSIDGRIYQIRREFPQNLALKALRMVRTQGEAASTAWMMETALGRDALKALEECETLRPADLLAITEIVRRKVMGEMEDEGKG